MKIEISDDDLALLDLGFELWEKENLQAALEAFDIAAENNRVCALRAHIAKGLIFLELHRVDKAELEFRSALEVNPFSRRASFFLYSTLVDEGRLQEAIAEGLRFFEGRKSTKEDRLIKEYRKQVEALTSYNSEQLDEVRSIARGQKKSRLKRSIVEPS